jgi:outer membrane receptor protein involved in Fe transport
MQLRAGYSQTINRPDIREIALAPYLDAEDRDVFIGNPDLQIAEIKNYDLRWEWYYSGSNNMQLAGFYKSLDKPIEEVLLLRGGGVLRTYENAKDAKVYGGEFAIRQGLDVLSDWTRDFYAKFNGSLIRSDVTVPDEASNQTNRNRRLQGQSNWVVNSQLTYDNLLTDSQATLVFNMFGPRIRDVGVQGFEDAKERSVPRLDFILRQGFPLFGQFATVRFRAKNLLDPNYIVKRETVTERKYKIGRSFELALTVEF